MRAWLVLLFLPLASAHDEGVGYDPAVAMFPDPDEVQAAILSAAGAPGVVVHDLGTSSEGQPIRMLEVTDPSSAVPHGQRVVTMIMTQQHGNEPAGTPAALQIIEQIKAQTGIWAHLENQVLLLLPQMNPDGSAAVQRANADGTDINRDHVALTTPEAQALHDVLNRWDVHMAMDHHEYGGVGVGYPSPVHIYDYDLTTMFPNHGNVRAPTAEMARTLNYDHIYPAVRADGYSISDYGWTTLGVADADPIKLQQTAGGPDPGILRNNYGLNNVVGLLVESFVNPVETPLASFDRRVGSHVSVMEAVLEFGASHGDELIETKRESERLNREEPMAQYVEGDVQVAKPTFTYEADDDLAPLWALHGFPAPVQNNGTWLYHADHGRGGLVAALLQPESSRNVAEGRVGAEAAHPDATHPDYGGPHGVVPTEEMMVPEQTTPAAPLALLALALLALARKR